ncbi:NmrA-like family protein [Leptodontidium sp. 2 PMI_412]|nr:NmrA-like family protein [Leptodontidium sp. 2 PMI_412]
MSSKKIIAVIGATGGQGGSVVKALLSDPKMSDWAIRGITRDATKKSSKKLASEGVEVVTGDLDSKASMLAAFKGVYAVFAVTNYWEKMDMELEIEQGKNLADAALETGVQHFIWSSLLNVTELTNGALLNVHHFDSKAKVEAYIRTTALPATYMLPGFYMSNFPNGNLKQSPPNNDWTLAMPVPVTAQVPLFATIEDAGKFVKGILNNREKTLGKRVLAATKYYSFQEMLDAFKAAFPEAGKTAQYFEAPHDVYKGFLTSAGLPEFAAQELLENMRLLNEGGYYGGESLEWSHSLVDGKLTTWEEFIKGAKAFADLK